MEKQIKIRANRITGIKKNGKLIIEPIKLNISEIMKEQAKVKPIKMFVKTTSEGPKKEFINVKVIKGKPKRVSGFFNARKKKRKIYQ